MACLRCVRFLAATPQLPSCDPCKENPGPVLDRLALEEMGIDPLTFSPGTRDLVSRLANSPGSRALVRDLAKVATKKEVPVKGALL